MEKKQKSLRSCVLAVHNWTGRRVYYIQLKKTTGLANPSIRHSVCKGTVFRLSTLGEKKSMVGVFCTYCPYIYIRIQGGLCHPSALPEEDFAPPKQPVNSSSIWPCLCQQNTCTQHSACSLHVSYLVLLLRNCGGRPGILPPCACAISAHTVSIKCSLSSIPPNNTQREDLRRSLSPISLGLRIATILNPEGLYQLWPWLPHSAPVTTVSPTLPSALPMSFCRCRLVSNARFCLHADLWTCSFVNLVSLYPNQASISKL